MGFLSEIVDDLLEERDVKEELMKRARKATDLYNSRFAQITLSPIGRKVEGDVREDCLFGCQRGNTLRILSVVLKENLKEAKRSVEIPSSSLVKLKRRFGSGSGGPEIHKPFLFLSWGGYVVGPAGGMVGEIPRRLDYLEEVEEEDFESFFKLFQKKRFVKGVTNELNAD